MADALDSGSSKGNLVEVRVLSSALSTAGVLTSSTSLIIGMRIVNHGPSACDASGDTEIFWQQQKQSSGPERKSSSAQHPIMVISAPTLNRIKVTMMMPRTSEFIS